MINNHEGILNRPSKCIWEHYCRRGRGVLGPTMQNGSRLEFHNLVALSIIVRAKSDGSCKIEISNLKYLATYR
jgi:hypothetical protein